MWTWFQQHPQQLLGKGIHFLLESAQRTSASLVFRYYIFLVDFTNIFMSINCAVWTLLTCGAVDPQLIDIPSCTTSGARGPQGHHPGLQLAHSHVPPSPASKGGPHRALQALCQGHSGDMGIHPACVGHCLGISACCHATKDLAFLDRESLALEVWKCDCIVVCNPQPKPPQFLYSAQAAYGADSHIFPPGLTPLCHPE